MKRSMLHMAIFICLTLSVKTVTAQDFDNAGNYMAYITKAQTGLNVKYLSYISAASHGKRMKVVEKKRADLINSFYETRIRINDMPSFGGDKSLRDSAVSYLKLSYSVFNEDYAKIVDMEEIAEQSYDAMEAYLLAQRKAGEKLEAASAAYTAVEKEFAKRNNINLIDEQSELDKKLETTRKINEYYDQVYLIFFKANRQEAHLLEALQAKNTNAIEQNRSALAKYSSEGIEALAKMKGFNSDKSLEAMCRKTLEFYKDEAEKKIPVLSDFILSTENFEQVKKAFEASTEKTKQSVDSYNKTIRDLNKGAENYNAMNKQLNGNRSALIDSYNSSVDAFLDTHMPYTR